MKLQNTTKVSRVASTLLVKIFKLWLFLYLPTNKGFLGKNRLGNALTSSTLLKI